MENGKTKGKKTRSLDCKFCYYFACFPNILCRMFQLQRKLLHKRRKKKMMMMLISMILMIYVNEVFVITESRY